jgi:radical SAM protein with 4Fe4S-binding SPASM domain
MKMEDAFSLLNEADKLGVKVIELTGGEPTIHNDFKKILEKAFSLDFELVGILSNGTNFSEDIYSIISKNKNRAVVQVDLHGSSKEYMGWFTGNSKSYDLVVESISRLAKLGVPTRVACNVTPQNVDQMLEIANLAYKLGAASVAFSPIVPIGRAQSTPEIILNFHKSANIKFVKNMNIILKKYGKGFVSVIDSSENTYPNCGAGSKIIVISPDLGVKICQMSPVIDNLGRYGNSLGSFLASNSKLIESISKIPAPNKEICGKCDNLWFCGSCITRGIIKAKEEGGKCIWKKIIVEKEPSLLKMFQN